MTATTPEMTVGTWGDFFTNVGDVAGDLLEGALDAIKDPANTIADNYRIIADAHQEAFEYAASRAQLYADLAQAAGYGPDAQKWSDLADNFRQEAIDRGTLGNEAYVQQLANKSYAALSKYAPIASAASDGAQLANALVNGDFNKVGQISTGMLVGALFGRLVPMMAFGMFPLLGPILVGAILGVVGSWIGQKLWDYYGEGITQWVSDMFSGAFNWLPRRDPLVLDLDGDGIETVGINTQNPILFDHDADGVQTGTGWIRSDDGFLVLDRNGNGTIDSGRELFGDNTLLPSGQAAADGFAALSAQDTNGDGAITAADTSFASLRVWRDLNQDGVSQSGELFTLSELGITSIGVTPRENSQTLPNGNQIADIGTYQRADGTLGGVYQTADVDLVEDTFHRDFTDEIPVAPGVEDLPNMRGSGLVRDMREAASLSTSLRDVLEDYSAATTRAAQFALIDALISAWAGTTDMDTLEERVGNNFALRWMQIGEDTNPNANDPPGTVSFPDPQWIALIQQTVHLFSVLEAFNGRYFFALPTDTFTGARSGLVLAAAGGGGGGGGGGGTVVGPPILNVSLSTQQLDMLKQSYEALREGVYNALLLQTRFRSLVESFRLDLQGDALVLVTTPVENELAARVTADPVNGLIDLIEFNLATRSTLVGTTWTGWSMLESYVRTLPVTPAVQAVYDEFNVLVSGHVDFSTAGSDARDIIAASDSAEWIGGNGGDDVIYGGGGNDQLSGGGGNDLLMGQDGNDYLGGDAGDDVLDGGAGNDTLVGSWGNDTYVINRGTGWDVISTGEWGDISKTDRIKFGPDISPADVRLTRYYDDLVISIVGSLDGATVQGYFYGDGSTPSAVEEIVFSDGTIWDVATVKQMVVVPTEGVDSITGYATNDTLTGLGGNDGIAGRGGDDSIDGGEGDDWLGGEDGDDTLIGGEGNDTLSGGNQNDTLQGGAGADYLGGDAGDDTLEGGAGSDTLVGSWGDDTFLINRGTGWDVISTSEWGSHTKLDRVVFGADIAPGDVKLTRYYDDLVISVVGTSDGATVQGYFSADAATLSAVELLVFNDGTVWDIATVKQMVLVPTEGVDSITGYATNDTLTGLGGNDGIAGRAGDDSIDGGEGDDWLGGEDGDDTLQGGEGNDTLSGGNQNDTLQGGAGADYLGGDAGDDTLEGGAGNDTLVGSWGDDTFLINRGTGWDVISTSEWGSHTKLDRVVFGADIAPGDVRLTRYYDDLVISIVGTSDGATIQGYFSADAATLSAVEQLVFNDGTIWDISTVKEMVLVPSEGADSITGYATNDTLTGLDGNDSIAARSGDDSIDGGEGDDWLGGEDGDDTLQGGEGNDTLSGGNQNDTLQGGAGADYLGGDAGDDTLEGGAGNDTLVGSWGNDTFLINRGTGWDVISTSEWGTHTKLDRIVFGADIATSDIQLTRYYDDLVISIAGTSDGATVQGYFAADASTLSVVEQLVFAGGTIWDVNTVREMVAGGTAGNDSLTGDAGDNYLAGLAGNDAIAGRAGNDMLDGGIGDDWVGGEDGDDALIGGEGNDTLSGGNHNDTLQGGVGADYLGGDAGDDTLEGGAGNDTLVGSWGNDTFLINRGTGWDVISTSEWGSHTKLDRVVFGADIATSDVRLTRYYDDLVINIVGTSDGATVQGYFSGDASTLSAVEQLVFNDGTIWDITTIKEIVLVPTEGVDSITGYATNDMLTGLDGNDSIAGRGGDDSIDGGAGGDWLGGEDGEDTLQGGEGNDTLSGGNHNDTLQGGAGADYLGGDAGDDTLEGGAGNDTLVGSWGNDTFLLNRGTGWDVISTSEWGSHTKLDRVVFGADIATSDVRLTRYYDDLVINIVGTSDGATVQGYFSGDATTLSAVEQLIFNDGTTWDITTVKQMVLVPTEGVDSITGYATNDALTGLAGNDGIAGRGGDDSIDGGDGDDWLGGEDGDDTLQGGQGNDTLSGGNHNDTLQGGAGADYLGGDAGDDTLEGGTGNDTLVGSWGNDTFLLNRGTGWDVISTSEWGSHTKLDRVVFGADIVTGDVRLTRYYDDLVINIVGTSDGATVQGYFSGDATTLSAVEQLVFNDGTIWDIATVKQMVLVPTEGVDSITGYATNDALTGLAGNDGIAGRGGDDSIDGGDGDDWLGGEDGNDTLQGGQGNDTLSGGNHNDTLQGGAGADYLGGDAGDDTLEGGTGNDTLVGSWGNDTFLLNRGTGWDVISTSEWGSHTKLDRVVFGADIATNDVRLSRYYDDLVINILGTSDGATVQGYFSGDATTLSAVEQLVFNDGTIWDIPTVKEKVLTGSDAAETITGYSTDDVLKGLAGNDSLGGQGGADLMQAGAGNDWVQDTSGNSLLDGGADHDTLVGGAASELLIGGTGNDSITTGQGADLIVFNRGGGADVIAASTVSDNTISLGGGIDYEDMSLRRSWDDLVLEVGEGESITLQGWYSSTNNHSVATLQMISEAMAAFAPGGTDPLLDHKVEQFDFAGLVGAFDAARAANPALTSWALSNALLDFHSTGSDSAALGGDLAYQYGLNGNLTGIGVASAQSVIGHAQFATAAQVLNPTSTLHTGVVRLD